MKFISLLLTYLLILFISNVGNLVDHVLRLVLHVTPIARVHSTLVVGKHFTKPLQQSLVKTIWL